MTHEAFKNPVTVIDIRGSVVTVVPIRAFLGGRMATITVDTWEEPQHFAYRLIIVDGDEVVLCESNLVRKADATQDEVETIAYTRARDFIGPTQPGVRRTVWDGDRPPVSAELACNDTEPKGLAPIKPYGARQRPRVPVANRRPSPDSAARGSRFVRRAFAPGDVRSR